MTQPSAPIPPVAAPFPTPPEVALSDRAGDVLGVQGERGAPPDPLTRAISTLDSVAGEALPAEESTVASRSRDRRREIVRSASVLFAERGYRGTSLRDISHRVGISHPGMLHHFKSKEALLDAVVDDLEGHAQYVIDHLDAYTRDADRLETLIRRDFAMGAQRMLLFAVLTTDVVNPEHPARLRTMRLRRVYEHIAERILREYRAQGRVREEVDLPWAARTIVSLSIALSTREATIGTVQPSAGGTAANDYLAFLALLRS